mgnify:CR=1 FL=1
MSELTPATAALSGRQHANWQLLQRASDFISRTVNQQPALQAVLTEDSHLQQMLQAGAESFLALWLPANVGEPSGAVILLPGIDAQEGRNIGQRLRESLEQVPSFYSPIGILPGVTASIGLAQMQSRDSLESLIARADKALYQAKQQGRNCLCG